MIAADLAGVRVWLTTTPVDLRKTFDGLAVSVRPSTSTCRSSAPKVDVPFIGGHR